MCFNLLLLSRCIHPPDKCNLILWLWNVTIVKQSGLRCARPFSSLHLAVEDHRHPNSLGPPPFPQTQHMFAFLCHLLSFQNFYIGRSNRPAQGLIPSLEAFAGLEQKIPRTSSLMTRGWLYCIKKKYRCHIAYGIRLHYRAGPNATGCLTHSIAQIELGPFGYRNHNI